MIHMAVDYDDSPKSYNDILENVNYFFTAVFFLECVLKLLAFGREYFNVAWNCFDFSVVCASSFEIILDLMSTTTLRFLRLGPQLIKVLRVMRVSRLLRLISRYKGLDALL